MLKLVGALIGLVLRGAGAVLVVGGVFTFFCVVLLCLAGAVSPHTGAFMSVMSVVAVGVGVMVAVASEFIPDH